MFKIMSDKKIIYFLADVGAQCPDEVTHWKDYCVCYREADCPCGNSKWADAPAPECLDTSKP